MILFLDGVLNGEDVARVRAELDAVAWRSGKATAGPTARDVKDNLQANAADERVQGLERFVLEALARHPSFEAAARPARMSRVLFSQYQPGMTYGAHTDDALMGPSGARLRTDLAFTVFLADPDSYEGGALAIETPGDTLRVRLSAGDAILYPAGTIHGVEPVTAGIRYAAVGWVQSLVRDAAAREILFDLSRARMCLSGAPEDLLALDKAVANLLRMWAEN